MKKPRKEFKKPNPLAKAKAKRRDYKNRIRVAMYPNDLYYKIFIATCHEAQQSNSYIGVEIIKSHFATKPQNELSRLIAVYNNMTPEERSFTDRKRI